MYLEPYKLHGIPSVASPDQKRSCYKRKSSLFFLPRHYIRTTPSNANSSCLEQKPTSPLTKYHVGFAAQHSTGYTIVVALHSYAVNDRPGSKTSLPNMNRETELVACMHILTLRCTYTHDHTFPGNGSRVHGACGKKSSQAPSLLRALFTCKARPRIGKTNVDFTVGSRSGTTTIESVPY